jgi:hypothetical protein
MKRKTRRGRGSFPIDAPVHDATVRLHYSVHRPAAPEQVLFSTRGSSNTPSTASADVEAGMVAEALEFTTGEGIMPVGVEMAVKLMLPGEQCTVTVHPEFGYSTCCTCAKVVDEVVPRDEVLVFLLELESFAKEIHPEAMNARQVCCLSPKLYPTECDATVSETLSASSYAGGWLSFVAP